MEQGQLQSTIPSSISSLTNLVIMDFDFNELSGSLPSELFTLTTLKELDLNNNTFSGSIDGIEKLTNLEFVQLHHNNFTGTIPSGMDQLLNLSKCRMGPPNYSSSLAYLSISHFQFCLPSAVFYSYDTNLGGAPETVCANKYETGGGGLLTLKTDCPCSCCTTSSGLPWGCGLAR